jgi:hypothetical protein
MEPRADKEKGGRFFTQNQLPAAKEISYAAVYGCVM